MHRTLSNVLITPHKGFYTQEALSAIASSTIASVSDFEGYARFLVAKRALWHGIYLTLNRSVPLTFRITRMQWDEAGLSYHLQGNCDQKAARKR